jgi:hypothetical protein
MHTTYAIDTCIENNENRGFGTGVYSRYICIPGICKELEYVRHVPEICLTYGTSIRIPDEDDIAADSEHEPQ